MLRESPGTIIVPCGDQAGYTDFWNCMSCMHRPSGTRMAVPRGSSIAHNLNRSIRSMKGGWVQIWGNDHTFPPYLLLNLLDRLDAHPEVGIIIPLCSKRRHPYHPPFGVRWWEKHEGTGMEELPWAFVPDPVDDDGLFEVHQAGLAGAVIRKEVLDAVGDPWFEWNTHHDTTRNPPVKIFMGEDYNFCHKVRDKGFNIFVDLRQPIGHVATPVLVPRWNGKQWVLDFMHEGWRVATITQHVGMYDGKEKHEQNS